MNRGIWWLVTAVIAVIALNIGVEWGISARPEFSVQEYTEERCAEIVPTEYGVNCVVKMKYEDDNIRIYRGIGSYDD